MRIVGIIPARMASSRFPGKPLVDIGGKSMIQRVYEQAINCDSLDEVYVATDHQDIFDEVIRFGGQVKMTASSHENGTSRCEELASSLQESPDVVINIQGDEPFFQSSDLDILLACFQDEDTQIATLAKRIEQLDEINNPTVVKVVFNQNNKALYFSRAKIPYARGEAHSIFYKHIGIYAYRFEVLKDIVKLPSSRLEETEKLEQLRWMENGYSIGVGFTIHDSNSVDTPEDLEKLKKHFKL